jgi:hypothetical protein
VAVVEGADVDKDLTGAPEAFGAESENGFLNEEEEEVEAPPWFLALPLTVPLTRSLTRSLPRSLTAPLPLPALTREPEVLSLLIEAITIIPLFFLLLDTLSTRVTAIASGFAVLVTRSLTRSLACSRGRFTKKLCITSLPTTPLTLTLCHYYSISFNTTPSTLYLGHYTEYE